VLHAARLLRTVGHFPQADPGKDDCRRVPAHVLSERTPKREREIANHPSIKPQSLMRQIVRAALPLGEGVIADPFMGSGSTVAAAEALGLHCVGVERYRDYYDMAVEAVPQLARVDVRSFAHKEVELESQLHLL
jgi:site-specific DNA-methyltransferase (adenine-specific)